MEYDPINTYSVECVEIEMRSIEQKGGNYLDEQGTSPAKAMHALLSSQTCVVLAVVVFDSVPS